MKLNTLWFLQKPIDLERAEYLLLAYAQEAQKNRGRISPFYKDISQKYQDLISFLSLRKTNTKLTELEQEELDWFISLGYDDPDRMQVYEIVKMAILALDPINKQFQTLWRQVESSLDLYYLGDIPPHQERRNGYILIRYHGSAITEIYRFITSKKNKISTKLVMYTDDSYTNIKDQLDPAGTFIIAELQMSFNTKHTTLPVITAIMESQVIKKPSKLGVD